MAEQYGDYKKQTKLKYNQFDTVNEDYEAQRKSLIPQAEKIAHMAAGPKPQIAGNSDPMARFKLEAWGDVWNRVFHGQMEVMAKAMGITQ